MENGVEKKPILEYEFKGLPVPNGKRIKIYGDGIVKIEIVGFNIESGKYEDGKVLMEKVISSEEASSYAERLINSGFFELKEEYHGPAFDGLRESMTLNYKGKTKTVSCQNIRTPSKEFNKIIKELGKFTQTPKDNSALPFFVF